MFKVKDITVVNDRYTYEKIPTFQIFHKYTYDKSRKSGKWEITYQASSGAEPLIRQVILFEGQQMQSNNIFTRHEITNQIKQQNFLNKRTQGLLLFWQIMHSFMPQFTWLNGNLHVTRILT